MAVPFSVSFILQKLHGLFKFILATHSSETDNQISQKPVLHFTHDKLLNINSLV